MNSKNGKTPSAYANLKSIKVHHDSRSVYWISLNRPDVRNAFNEQVIEELTAIFSSLQGVSPRAIILRGNGPVFSAGGDLNWMKKSASLSKEENLKDTTALTHMFRLMNECPFPVIGLLHGAAIGGGVGLVSCCDYVCAEEETVFSLSEVRLGLVPACIGPFVIPKIGVSQARALFVSAERFKAQKAKEIGLIHEVVKGIENLENSAEIILKRILECGPQAIQAAKKLILNLSWPEKRQNLTDCYHFAAEMLADLRVSPEGQEGVSAFLEKRKPKWID